MTRAQKLRLAVSLSAMAVLAAGTSFWVHAQSTDARPVPSLLPPGALIYLEAKDFGSLLTEWNNSAEKKRWLTGANYRVMSLSRLVQRLSQAQDEFAALAGLPVGMNLADQAAGTRSGFAFYNLSALSFVYITQMPASRVETTSLWRSRARYQSREVAGIPFYVKSNEAGARTIAFTSYKDWFVISTDEDRMAATLVLLSGAQAASLATESWFVEALKQSAAQGDLRLVYNLRTLLSTPQFRTYWIQRNASELKPFASGISDLFQRPDGFEEQRAMLRISESPVRESDASLSQALAYAPPAASLYRAWSMPDPRTLSEVLQQVVAGERPPRDVYNAPAPEVTPEAGAVGSEADLEIRIDEAPFQRSSESSITPLSDALLAMQPVALLHVQNTVVLRDQVFVTPSSAAVVICKQPDRAALDRALAQTSALQTGDLDPLRVSVNGRAVILARMNLPGMDLPRSTAALSLPPDATYAAVYNHLAEWGDYKKLFAVIDTHAANPEMMVSSSVPPFFSGDLKSLGETLSRLRSASILSADPGGETVDETVRYRFTAP
ncbi:MAG: hypothetical protein WB992_12990 [Bryobacteraceae bacterium]